MITWGTPIWGNLHVCVYVCIYIYIFIWILNRGFSNCQVKLSELRIWCSWSMMFDVALWGSHWRSTPATPFGGSKGAPFWVWGPPGFPFRTCKVLRQVLNIVHLDVICMLYIYIYIVICIFIYIYVYNIHLYFTWWFRIIAAPKVLNVGCDYQAQLIRGGAEASPASHGSGPRSSWFWVISPAASRILSNGYGSIPISTIFSGVNIHKSQLFWCEQKGYYWFWHTAKWDYHLNIIEDVYNRTNIHL